MRILLLVTVAAIFVSATAAYGITRDQVLARAQSWVDNPVPYSQGAYYDGYRTDCSGYASMCLQTGFSYATFTFHNVAYPIAAADLKPGDLMLNTELHVRVFYGWVDAAHTQYVAYEQTSPNTMSSVRTFANDIANGYEPYRYNKIVDSPEPWNLIKNPTFDVWSYSKAVWWTVSTDAAGTVGQRLRGLSHASSSSLLLVNRGVDRNNPSKAAQTVAVSAGKTYALSAWACSAAVPGLVGMRLEFLDTSGATLSSTSTAGDAWNINASAFTQMSRVMQAPAGAVNARVTIQVSRSATNATSTAVFDDVSLSVVSPMPVYRFYNVNNSSHFYTASGVERDIVAANYSATYIYEGPAYDINILSPADNTPLYRFYNKRNGSHFYTASAQERDLVIATYGATYTYEGAAYNVSMSATNATPVYRFFNMGNGSHFYTASAEERDSVIATYPALYAYEGIAYYLPR